MIILKGNTMVKGIWMNSKPSKHFTSILKQNLNQPHTKIMKAWIKKTYDAIIKNGWNLCFLYELYIDIESFIEIIDSKRHKKEYKFLLMIADELDKIPTENDSVMTY